MGLPNSGTENTKMIRQLPFSDQLLQLPLFQGMSRTDLEAVVGQTRFNFTTLKPGTPIARDGQECQHLHLLLDGTTQVESYADDHSYTFIETLHAPLILQPECLFGLTPRFTHTFMAQSECRLITLSKTETIRLSDNFFIFKLNLLNILSTQAQKIGRLPWHHSSDNLKSRIAQFFLHHCLHPAGMKLVSIKMTQLARELNDSRLDISRALHILQTDGLIRLSRGKIEIPAIERLK